MMSEKKIPETIFIKACSLEISTEKKAPTINQDAAIVIVKCFAWRNMYRLMIIAIRRTRYMILLLRRLLLFIISITIRGMPNNRDIADRSWWKDFNSLW